MRIVPIPDDVALGEHQRKSRLGPPPGVPSSDCDTIDVVLSEIELPSGVTQPSVMALVWASERELDRIRETGGHFWIEFFGTTFPPVRLFAPPELATDEPRCGSCGGPIEDDGKTRRCVPCGRSIERP